MSCCVSSWQSDGVVYGQWPSQLGQVLDTDVCVFYGQLSRVVSIQRPATEATGVQLCSLLVPQ